MIDSLVTLVKHDGTTLEEIPAHVQSKLIIITDDTIPIEIGDHFLRKLKNGLSEDFIVEDYAYYDRGIMGLGSHFQITVRRNGSPLKQGTIIQNITNNNINNNQYGDHSKINTQSTDNSQNISLTISSEQLTKFVDEVSPVLNNLPDDQRQLIEGDLTVLREEAAKATPSQMKIRGALESIKSAAEGAAGNLVAAGIVALITKFL